MSVPLYVPVLPTRRHAVSAYDVLTPDIKRRIAPLWTLPPRPAPSPRPPAQLIREDADSVAAAHRHGFGWLDAPFVDDGGVDVLAEAISPGWWEHRNLWPVTGPGRPGVQQALVLAVARRLEHGLGIRVRLADAWHDGTASEVGELVDQLPLNHPVDLLLDLGTVLPDRPDAGKEALRALDTLVPLTSWRTVAVVAGGFPEPPADFRLGVGHRAPRSDWEAWEEIQQSERQYLRRLVYGDYGIQPATYVARVPPSSKEGGGKWGVLRYTTARSYHLSKVLHGKRYDGVNREAARDLTRLADFRSPAAGAGERWLCDRAEGVTGPGNHETWNRVGSVQHLTFVVRCLAG